MNQSNNLTCLLLDFTISWQKTEGVYITNIITCVLNSLFSLLTCAGNFIILHAIRKSQDLHSPLFILLSCLAVSDFLVGAVCQPFFVVIKIAELVDNFSCYCTVRTLQFTFAWITSGVSFLILAVVSIDRLLALTLHLRYDIIVTIPRIFETALVLWGFSITVAMLRFWMSYDQWIFLPLTIFLFTLVVVTFSNSKIFHIVRRHQRQINNQTAAVLSHQTNTVNVLKCRKSAVTVLYVYGLFLVFYFPFSTTMIIESFIGHTASVEIAYAYVTTAVFINSFLNPLVYCWRIRDIRRAVRNVLGR